MDPGRTEYFTIMGLWHLFLAFFFLKKIALVSYLRILCVHMCVLVHMPWRTCRRCRSQRLISGAGSFCPLPGSLRLNWDPLTWEPVPLPKGPFTPGLTIMLLIEVIVNNYLIDFRRVLCLI